MDSKNLDDKEEEGFVGVDYLVQDKDIEVLVENFFIH